MDETVGALTQAIKDMHGRAVKMGLCEEGETLEVLDLLDEIERLQAKADMFEKALLKLRVALGLDIHSNDDLLEVVASLRSEKVTSEKEKQS